ncbi:MAG TPA: hypothetical protein VM713_08550 [Steroidobacteraceae bacterium]|nr:hypothetical protein [Steroidobacteraceae bacterium]
MNRIQMPFMSMALALSMVWVAGCQRAPSAETAQPAAAGKEAASVEAEGLTLKPDEIEKAGIKTTPASAARRAPETAGYALVIAREAIAQAVADLSSATAVARQSQAALARSRGLAGTPGAMPVESQEAAERQAAVDQAALTLAKRRVSAVYGSNAPWKDDYASPLLASLASGEAKLTRVTFPLGALGAQMPSRLRLAHMGGAPGTKSFEVDTLWRAPADASLPGRSFFGILRSSDVADGERLLAFAPVGPAEDGVVIPYAAVVLSAGKYWCYLEEKPGQFVRTEVDPGAPTDDGYFVKEGVAAGAQIVTASAGELLARELGTAAE